MMPEPRTIGWLLDARDRALLLDRFPPLWPDVVAHHVTLASKTEDPLPSLSEGAVVGQADDGEGVQALVVAIDGSTDRPDGSVFHITWSLDKARGRTARQSNDVLRDRGWAPIDASIPIRLTPAVLD